MSRKSELKALFGGTPIVDTPVSGSGLLDMKSGFEPSLRVPSGSVKAMGLALGDLSARADEADRLRIELDDLKQKADETAGARIVELDSALIDASPFADRLSAGATHDDSFAELSASLKADGQQVPVLVRPHPKVEGRYQAAYGHRRIRALGELGIAVKAQVRDLDDAALMLAQGKENAERRNLSFIEKALFAQTLSEAGFARPQVQAALAVHKAELTRLFQVAEAIPVVVARAIGPAPKTGRPRWMALGELLKRAENRAKAGDEIISKRFLEAATDQRFLLVWQKLLKPAKPQPMPRASSKLILDDGRIVGRFTGGLKPEIAFEPSEIRFAEWLAENFARLHAQYVEED
jgi:ParB family transcriptional regulator, chromosome partitioning protein